MDWTTARLLNANSICLALLIMLGFSGESFAQHAPSQTIWLEDLDVTLCKQLSGFATIKATIAKPMRLCRKKYSHGIGMKADSSLLIELNDSAKKFSAKVGIDAEVGTRGSATFIVLVDGLAVYNSGQMRGGMPARSVNLSLEHARRLELVLDGGDNLDFDRGDWADAKIITTQEAKARPIAISRESEVVPDIASGDPPQPMFHGARTIGTTPGYPFLWRVPVTGAGVVKIETVGLPEGLAVDADGIIQGAVEKTGVYNVLLLARNSFGECSRRIQIVAGQHKLALTPPMGWNSWNAWGVQVNAQRVKEAADAMLMSGLASKGFSYINIDDAWQSKRRSAAGQIESNEKFPDIGELSQYVHELGLKLGIYSSPGETTCGGYPGSYRHENQDADSWRNWNVDYLKYDWCSYSSIEKRKTVNALSAPYVVMRKSLDNEARDIIYNLCQYGEGDVWNWAASRGVGANSWRVSGDIADKWESVLRNGFNLFKLARFAGPGHWNDPDMLVVGKVGWGEESRNTRLTPNEQISHVTLWCMVAAPLLIGCDMTKIDKFTTDILTNGEVLDLDQDDLGVAAVKISEKKGQQIWARPLFDGTIAVALFNLAGEPTNMRIVWNDLKRLRGAANALKGLQPARDLWRQRDLAVSTFYEALIPRHGCVLLKVGIPKNNL